MSRLETLKEDLKEKKFYDIAKIIIKYQDYKKEIIISKLDNFSLGAGTKRNYIHYGKCYIKTKKRSRSVSNGLYNALDKVMAEHVQPLRPSFEEKCREYKKDYTKKENIPSVANLEVIKKPLTASFEYGVRIGNDIKILESEDVAKGFIQGLKFAGNNNAVLVGVEVQNL